MVRGTITRVMATAVMVDVEEGYRFMLPREQEGEDESTGETVYNEG